MNKVPTIIIIVFLFGGIGWGLLNLVTWDLTTTCAARWQDVGETHWSRNAQCRVKIDGVFVPEENVIFSPKNPQ